VSGPTTLANSVRPGAGYVHLNEPVPAPCRITLSPDTAAAETVPVYLCSRDEIPVVQLGYGQPYSDRVVLARAHAAGSPVRVEVDDTPKPEDDCPGLQPYSGKDGACPKCGSRCAETKWLMKPASTDIRVISSWSTEIRPWYSVYLIGGNAARYDGSSSLNPANWYPQEWLARHCLICQFRWDEALAATEQAGGAE
jgi:hypothetical protein